MRLQTIALLVATTACRPLDEDPRFTRDVMPVLKTHCARCHASRVTFGAFDAAATAWPYLTGPMNALPTGFHCGEQPVQREFLVVAGNASASPLWQLVGLGFDSQTGECPGRPKARAGMPKDGAGILADIDPDGALIIKRWIELGARND